jgi:formylmethanofuran dehydrogenase subunit B
VKDKPDARFTLITGRTSKQAVAMHQGKGKESSEYLRQTSLVQANEQDIARLGLAEGQAVRVHTDYGQAEALLEVGKLPPGLLFMPLGPAANALIGPATHGTGMPDSKGLSAWLEPLPGPLDFGPEEPLPKVQPEPGVETITHENAVCPFCGALCDDIAVEVQGSRIVAVKNTCANGRSLFMSHHYGPRQPTVGGKEASWDEAVQAAVDILCRSDSPLIYGLSSSACEAQRRAIALADLLGAYIDSTSSVCHGPSGMAIQMEGEPTCTLGEVRHRADLVIFWGCNPAQSHIRHFTRYSVTVKGELTPRGRKDRTVVLVDVRPSDSSKTADIFLQIEPGRDFEVISTLRALLKGVEIGREEVGGVAVSQLAELVERMKSCRSGIIFFGMGVTMTRGKHHNISAVIRLTAELNAYTRFFAMPMRGHGNVAGADVTLTWQTGYPFAVSFARGYPQFNPGEFTTVDLLARRQADAALILASDPLAHLPRPAADYLAEIPVILLDAGSCLTARVARVVFPTAAYGLDAAGTAYRMDNIPLRLHKIVEPTQPTDEEILVKIIEGVKRCCA